ncbi:hypothetical protein EG832_20350 [bacterium]|nr:hypothetical protein [bacterium]
MDAILHFLTQYEILFYILLGAVILVYVRKVYLAWRDWSMALFGLEKEIAQRKINAGLSLVLVSTLLAIGLFVINTFVTPSVPGVFQVATPTVDLTAQPTLFIETPMVEATSQGLIPTLSAFLNKGCVPGQVNWSYPLDGDGVSGQVELSGTVNITNLGYFKIEYSPIDQDNWIPIMAGRQVVENAPFGSLWNSADLTPGDYRIRIVVFTNQQEKLPECEIKILVKAVQQN